jgi:hypothetical protein
LATLGHLALRETSQLSGDGSRAQTEEPLAKLLFRLETTGFSRVEFQCQPNAVTVLHSQRPLTLVAWSLNFSLLCSVYILGGN